MNCYYSRDYQISYTQTDRYGRISPFYCFAAAQDIMTEYMETLEADNVTTSRRHNAVWVISRARLRLFRYPGWEMRKLIASAYTTAVKSARIENEALFRDGYGRPCFAMDYELCPIDLTERKLRRISTVTFPAEPSLTESVIGEPFGKLSSDFSGDDLFSEITVEPFEIDYSSHMNNIMYIRRILNTFPSDHWKDRFLSEIRVRYVKEAREGEVLSVYRKEIRPGVFAFLFRRGEEDVLQAEIVCG